MHLLVGPLPDERPAAELAFAHAMVRRASRGDVDATLRVYRPTRPMVVFGRRDTRLPGFTAAVDAIRSSGFATAVRATGGRAVAYTEEAVVIDLVRREAGSAHRQEERFEALGDTLVEILQRLGVDAQLGAVPGEYCPGAHSINARGAAKLIGTAQRAVRDAWLFSALLQVGNVELLAPILDQVYTELGLPFDPRSVGAISAESPGIDTSQVEQAALEMFGAGASPVATTNDAETLTLARTLLPQHIL